MHKRRQFLESIRTQLRNTSLFGGVWISRTGPARAVFPSVTIYADQETVETLTIHAPARPQDRVLIVAVTAWIRGTPNDERPDEEMDKSAELLESNVIKPTGADDMILIATDFEVDLEDPEIHAVTLTYQIRYTLTEFSPSA